MGGVLKQVFGGSGSKQSSNSENQAFNPLMGMLQGNVGQGNNAMGTLGALLGLGGDTGAAKAGFDNYLDSSGYKFMLDSGNQAITGNAASKGLLRSGSTGKAFQQYGQDLASTKFKEYTDQLTGLGNYGMQSAQTIAGAGQKSTSEGKSSSSGGIFNSLFPGGLSDIRTKNIIEELGEDTDGLKVFLYEYKRQPGVHYVGVIAQDVKLFRPEALGPTTEEGYLTVDYPKLPQVAGCPAWGRVEGGE